MKRRSQVIIMGVGDMLMQPRNGASCCNHGAIMRPVVKLSGGREGVEGEQGWVGEDPTP